MYNNPYEEYMRNSLGYNKMPMMDMNSMNQMNTMTEMYEDENSCTYNQASVDDMYPEIYKIIYPMVCKACMAVDENISEDLVSRITNDIYVNVENMEVCAETRTSSISVTPSKSNKSETLTKTTSGSVNNVSNVRQQETRQKTPLLRDLIRILVLRELLGSPRRPFRPPYGGNYGRPPFGGSFGPGVRPTFGF